MKYKQWDIGEGAGQMGMWIFRDILFWEKVAEVYDTFGIPRDLIMLRLRQSGLEFTDEEFDRLLDYMVRRRNGQGEVEDITQFLIRTPDGFVSEGVVDAWVFGEVAA